MEQLNKKSWNYQFTDLPNHQTIIWFDKHFIMCTLNNNFISHFRCCIVIYLKNWNTITLKVFILLYSYYFNNIYMCILCKNIKTIGLENLNYSNCQTITSIPHIDGLQKFHCYYCGSICKYSKHFIVIVLH